MYAYHFTHQRPICNVHVCANVCASLCVCVSYQGDSREDLQQGDEVVSISQVFIQVCDVLPHLRKREKTVQHWHYLL